MRTIQGQDLTRHFGRPTFKAVSQTCDKLTSIYAAAKTSHPSFPYESKFGYAAAVTKTTKFADMHGKAAVNVRGIDELDNDWECECPTRPDVYDSAINAGTSDAVVKKERPNGKIKFYSLTYIFQGCESVVKDKIAAAYNMTWLKGLRDKVLTFSHVTAQEVLEELDSK